MCHPFLFIAKFPSWRQLEADSSTDFKSWPVPFPWKNGKKTHSHPAFGMTPIPSHWKMCPHQYNQYIPASHLMATRIGSRTPTLLTLLFCCWSLNPIARVQLKPAYCKQQVPQLGCKQATAVWRIQKRRTNSTIWQPHQNMRFCFQFCLWRVIVNLILMVLALCIVPCVDAALFNPLSGAQWD